jgi:hypothetical protein
MRKEGATLRRKGAEGNPTLNQAVTDELIAAEVAVRSRADFSDPVGRWTPDPGFDEILVAQRRINHEEWK